MSITAIILIGLTFLTIASLIALGNAINRAEEGYEDNTGYHRKKPDQTPTATGPSTVDTGNPWDQIEGSSCPWHFNPTLRRGNLPAHQP